MFGSRLRSEADQDRFLLKIYETARQLTRKIKDDDPADVVNDIAISCLSKLRDGTWKHEPVNFDSFVLKLVNDCRADRRRRRMREDSYDAEHYRDREPTTQEWMLVDRSRSEESMEDFRRSLVAKLPVGCRSSYRLVREQGFTYTEAAATLGIAAKTVHNHIVYAQRILRAQLREAGIHVAYSSMGGRPRGGRWRNTKVRLAPRYLPPEPAKTDCQPVGMVRSLAPTVR
jgi:RNA polymerase sigma factor (sigma-70 family)